VIFPQGTFSFILQLSEPIFSIRCTLPCHATCRHFPVVTDDANPDRRASIETRVSITRVKTGTLLLRCTTEEAEEIRRAAQSEHRTISGYILDAVLNRIAARDKLLREVEDNRRGNPSGIEQPIPNL
jgi:hypothetical protein